MSDSGSAANAVTVNESNITMDNTKHSVFSIINFFPLSPVFQYKLIKNALFSGA